MKINSEFIFVSTLLLSSSVYATEAVDELLEEYQQVLQSEQEEVSFTAEAGEILWFQEFADEKSGKIRQCTTCHTDDLRNEAKHTRTGKLIKPMAPSVNEERLTKIKNIRKWLKRNCKWTLGRECSAQEKGDVLTFIQAQ